MAIGTRADRAEQVRIVTMLDTLAARRTPPIAADIAARWTERIDGTPPDALIDVWVAVDDWAAAGCPAYGGFPADKGDPYARLVACLTAFHGYLRYGARP